jgi:transcription elongation GreA/GreB family factor
LPAQTPKKTAEGAVSSDVAQQIKLIAVDLASVRRNMGQLAANQDQFAAKQEQMNQSIATLQQVEQDAKQQVFAPPAPKPAHPPAHNPPQPSPR